eukprot:TRINITY_DN5707_c0_g1_i1.p1 TRINITY_DN5707_c0_g1~~TRINITY_DN5707_c0_g1_i1.p1  ORF type:complete len:903 (-),score=199.86 TRINITY_DN5707_c0_g1_i1:137-2845(-)
MEKSSRVSRLGDENVAENGADLDRRASRVGSWAPTDQKLADFLLAVSLSEAKERKFVWRTLQFDDAEFEQRFQNHYWEKHADSLKTHLMSFLILFELYAIVLLNTYEFEGYESYQYVLAFAVVPMLLLMLRYCLDKYKTQYLRIAHIINTIAAVVICICVRFIDRSWKLYIGGVIPIIFVTTYSDLLAKNMITAVGLCIGIASADALVYYDAFGGRYWLNYLFYMNAIAIVIMLPQVLVEKYARDRFYLCDCLDKENEQVRHEQQKSEWLILNMVPRQIAERLKYGEENVICDYLNETSIFFADVVQFTNFCSKTEAKDVVTALNEIFCGVDNLIQKYGLTKIKTIGDAIMVVSGAPTPRWDHAHSLVRFSLEVVQFMDRFNRHRRKKEADSDLKLRMGIHTGPLVAGVIGKNKRLYDIWGAAVEMAQVMESSGQASRVHISKETYKCLLRDHNSVLASMKKDIIPSKNPQDDLSEYFFEEHGIESAQEAHGEAPEGSMFVTGIRPSFTNLPPIRPAVMGPIRLNESVIPGHVSEGKYRDIDASVDIVVPIESHQTENSTRIAEQASQPKTVVGDKKTFFVAEEGEKPAKITRTTKRTQVLTEKLLSVFGRRNGDGESSGPLSWLQATRNLSRRDSRSDASSEIGKVIRLRSFDLRFDDDTLEARYRENYAEKMMKQARGAQFLAFFIFIAGFEFLEWWDLYRMEEFRIIRYCWVCPPLLIAIGLSYVPSLKNHMQTIILVCDTAAGFGALYWPVYTNISDFGDMEKDELEDTKLAHHHILLGNAIILFIALFTTLRFTRAMGYCVLLMIYQEFVMGFADELASGNVLLLTTLTNLLMLMIGGIISYELEMGMRRDYILRDMLSQEAEILKAEKARSEALLLNIIPESIANRLKSGVSSFVK